MLSPHSSENPPEQTPEDQIEALKQQLARARQSAALGELLGTTTHEFNNILMTIINYAKLGMRHQDQAARDKAFEKILAAGQRASKVTSCVLGMARNRGSDLEPTDLREVIDGTLLLLEKELSKYRISLDLHLEEVPQAIANGNQIQQVLLNLLINARQAMQNGGTVTIKLCHDLKSNTVDLTIRDSGAGIPQDKLPRIFDSYYSTKDGPDESGKGGTGLGLSACKEIIEAHKGRIRVQSKEGVGTAFTIKLPAEVQRSAAAG